MALVVKKLPVNEGEARDEGSIPGGEHGNLLQYFCLESRMIRGVRQASVHGVTQRQESDMTEATQHTHMHHL